LPVQDAVWIVVVPEIKIRIHVVMELWSQHWEKRVIRLILPHQSGAAVFVCVLDPWPIPMQALLTLRYVEMAWQAQAEDCDLGIAPSSTLPTSAMSCSQSCQHQGSKLFNVWCYNNLVSRGGFTQAAFDAACKNALSVCGDGVTSPDEDAGCDLGNGRKASWCNALCLNNDLSHTECVAGTEGCDSSGQHVGASLLYSEPIIVWRW
jgi:hypothetical protein